MATGIIGVLANNGSLSYTAGSTSRLRVSWAGASTNISITYAGATVAAATGSATITTGALEIWIAGGQTVTVAAGASQTAVVSALESLT